jgi:trypsin-like peptidase
LRMALPTEPLTAIFPVLKVDCRGERVLECLGTGFFVRDDGLVMSCAHVLGVHPAPGEMIAVIPAPGKILYFVLDVIVSPRFDIAVGRLYVRPPGISILAIAERDMPINVDVLTVEFSGTTSSQAIPYYRKGHVITRYVSDFGNLLKGATVLDLSFPALKGASGAPVLVEREGVVIGMVVSNVERHLLPAHLERLESPDGSVEEHQYFLPVGQAISWQHLRDFLLYAPPVESPSA